MDWEQIDWRRAFHDHAYFAAVCFGAILHDGQVRWLDNSHRRENILVTGNRWGKSFAAAVKLIHHALYQPRLTTYDGVPYRMLTASITQEQANIIFNRAVRMAQESAVLSPFIESITVSPYPRMVYGNGSILEARSTHNRGTYLLGQDYDFVVFDEVAFEPEPDYVVEEVIQMRLADRAGRLDLISTPNGKGWLYQRVRDLSDGTRDGYVQSGDTRENTNIAQDFIRERLAWFTPERVQQNIMGQFIDTGKEIVKGEYVDWALGNHESPGLSSREPGFITGWDLARKRTATVGITVAVGDGVARVERVCRFREADWSVVIAHIRATHELFPGQLVIDATGVGDVILEQVRDLNPLPFIFTESSKAELLTNLELFHAKGAISYKSWEFPDGYGKRWSLEDELRSAQWSNNTRYDGVMALGLALWPLRTRAEAVVAPRVGRL